MTSQEFKQGQDAYRMSRRKTENPHPKGSVQYAQWNAGYDYEAKAETDERE